MDNPIFIPIVFAANGLKNPIYKVRQAGQPIEDFTWNDGAPQVTMTPKEDGGKAPKGQDFNGVLNAMCQHTVFSQNGGRYKWQQSVIDEYGNYKAGAIIQADDEKKEFICITDNSNNPNDNMTGWSIYSGQGSVPIASSTNAGVMKVLNTLNSTDVASALSAAQGKVLSDMLDMVLYAPIEWFQTTAPSGYIVMDGRTISQNQYPKLFARYGEKLPDLRGVFIRGYGGNSAPIGVVQGDAIRNITGTYQAYFNSQLSAKTGAFYDAGQTGGGSGGDRNNRALGFDASRVVPTANENRPRNIAFLYIVKAG